MQRRGGTISSSCEKLVCLAQSAPSLPLCKRISRFCTSALQPAAVELRCSGISDFVARHACYKATFWAVWTSESFGRHEQFKHEFQLYFCDEAATPRPQKPAMQQSNEALFCSTSVFFCEWWIPVRVWELSTASGIQLKQNFLVNNFNLPPACRHFVAVSLLINKLTAALGSRQTFWLFDFAWMIFGELCGCRKDLIRLFHVNSFFLSKPCDLAVHGCVSVINTDNPYPTLNE